jgi:uncharacterized protein YggL (DUF469 family)
MTKITRDSLMTLEAYAKARPEMRAKVMAHKKNRTLHLGEHITLIFEDELTMRYQIQEMLRAERIFEDAGIQDELDAYNPLVPDGCNWKATMMIEYDDVEERRAALSKLIGVEGKVWVQVADFDRVYAIADEDLERETEQKTSSVHFLRFELSPEMGKSVRGGAAIRVGVDHPAYQAELATNPAQRDSLAADISV